MYCPECGNNIADESAKFCPVCGYELNNASKPKFSLASEQPQSNQNNQQQPNNGYAQSSGYNTQPGGGYQQPVYNQQSGGGYQQSGYNQQPMYNSQSVGGYRQPAVSQPPKQNTGLIIGVIIGAVVLIVAIVIFLVFFVFKKDDTGNKDTTSPQTVEDTQDNPLPDDINTSEEDISTSEEDISTSESTASGDIVLGTYSISSARIEGQDLNYNDIESIGYGEMTIRAEHDYIYFKETADGYEVPYYYTDSNGTGKIWNSVEEYTIYYTDDTITIDFASSDQFSEYTGYTMTFSR